MRYVRLSCILLLCLAFSPCKLCAQTAPTASASAAGSTIAGSTAAATPSAPVAVANPQTPEEFFARARQLSDLEASGIPFHLKATYVASGDAEFTGNGTYEEWWQSKDLWRKEATLGGYKYVEIQYGGKNSVYASSDYVPLRLRQTLDAVLIRIAPDTGTGSEWKLKKKTLNHVELIVLSSDGLCGEGNQKAKCVTQDYLTPSGVLRIHVRDVIENLFNGLQPFHGLIVPRNIVLASYGIPALTISISSLELLIQGQISLKMDGPLPEGLHPITKPIYVKAFPPNVASTKALKTAQPIYPAEAKQRRIQGMVVTIAGIDESGNIREPYVIRSAGPLLDKSALDAVRHWKYSPVMVNGVAVDAEVSISVVYTLTE
jgi:TonB family protein